MKPKPKQRIPALSPDRLKLFENALTARYSPQIVAGVMSILKAAANPKAETFEAAMEEIHPARAQAVRESQGRLDSFFNTHVGREIDPAAWSQLLSGGGVTAPYDSDQ